MTDKSFDLPPMDKKEKEEDNKKKRTPPYLEAASHKKKYTRSGKRSVRILDEKGVPHGININDHNWTGTDIR